MVTTVLGEIEKEDLGVTLPHEHLLIDLRMLVNKPDPAQSPEFYEKLRMDNLWRIKGDPYALEDNALLDDKEQAVAEMAAYRAAGGRSVVDVTLRSIGRDPLALREISRRSGVHVVMGCGQYIGAAHEKKVETSTAEELAAEMIGEILEGADGTDVRAGVIGEIGTSEVISENEWKCVDAAAMASLQTGKSIHVHTALFERNGFAVCDRLTALGVKPERIAIDHVDAKTDPDYILALLDRGVYVEFDNFGKEFYVPKDSKVLRMSFDYDTTRVKVLKMIAERGHLDRVLISNDICLKNMWYQYGGNGYFHMLHNIIPMLRDYGFTQEQIVRLYEKNPQNFLCGETL